MDEATIRTLVKTTIEAQIVKALNEGPEMIEKLVKASLELPVDQQGNQKGWGDKMPYIDYLVGNEIRFAAQAAVRKVVSEMSETIEANVRTALSDETVAKAFAKAIIGSVDQDWRVNVNFEAEKRDR